MNTFIFDFLALCAIILPLSFLSVYLITHCFLKKEVKKILSKSISKNIIEFTEHSPLLLKAWMQKNPQGKLSLLVRYFFSYECKGEKISGQVVISNMTLVDIKFYPAGYSDPYGQFPLMSANDEHIEKNNVIRFNDF